MPVLMQMLTALLPPIEDLVANACWEISQHPIVRRRSVQRVLVETVRIVGNLGLLVILGFRSWALGRLPFETIVVLALLASLVLLLALLWSRSRNRIEVGARVGARNAIRQDWIQVGARLRALPS